MEPFESEFPIGQIMQRYELYAAKDLLFSYEELRRMGVDQQFIYALLQTFEDISVFSPDDYAGFPLDVIVDYILRSHKYYLNTRLLEIEQSIDNLLKDYSDSHPLLPILRKFFAEYKNSLNTHMKAEEKYLLPYINELIRFSKDADEAGKHFNGTNFTLKEFVDNHTDTEKDLSDVRSAIEAYHPPSTNQTPYRILLSQLEAFERDMMVHALIEDKVLVPRALELEKMLNEKYTSSGN